ncbi:ferredoxin [Pinisolibacter sp.]|uniref:ferredoxin n=1 Tax=Pinisolibacter sp. TaxID=2172024 RepID=UPI002FDE9CE7
MVKVVFIEPTGGEVELDATEGWSLMQVATSQGVDGIDAECGGSCACATCHCYVEGEAADQVPAPSEAELAMLEHVVAERRSNSRLCCQIKATPMIEGLILRVAETQS